MNIHVANLKTAALNPTLPEEKRLSARNQLETIAGDASDSRSRDAQLVLRELGEVEAGNNPDTDNLRATYTENVQPNSEEFAINSVAIRARVWMALADENAAKAGGAPFEYADGSVRDECRAFYEAWRRARTVPMFWDYFNENLTESCKSLMSFNFPRPTEAQ